MRAAAALLMLAGCTTAQAPVMLPPPFEPVAVGVFRDARALDADGRGRLYVADAGARAVHVLTAAGALVQTISGTDDYPLEEPVDVVAFGGLTISVADAGLEAIARFGRDGRALGLIRMDGRTRATGLDETLPADAGERFVPVALAAAPDGTLYAASAEGAVIQITPDFRRTVLRRPDTADALVGVDALAATDRAVYVAASGRVLRFDRLMVRGLPVEGVEGVRSLGRSGDRIVAATREGVVVLGEGGPPAAIGFPAAVDVRGAVGVDGALLVLTATGLWRLAL